MDFQPLLQPYFWFRVSPPALLPQTKYGFMIFFGALAIAAIVIIWMRTKTHADALHKRYLERWFAWALFLSLWGWGMIFMEVERVAFFSSRFWYVVWLAVSVWWGIYLLRDIRTLRVRRAKMMEQEQFRKYLPKKKR